MNDPEVIETLPPPLIPVESPGPEDDDGIVPPWGLTPSSALRWAFNHTLRSKLPPNALALMQKSGKRGRSIDMTAEELGWQAGLIREEVTKLDEPECVSILMAYYLPRPVKERIAGGGIDYTDKYYNDRKPAIRALGYWLMKQQTGGGQVFQAGYEEAATQYCIHIYNNDRLCNRLKVRRDRADEQREIIFEKLADLRQRALMQIGARLTNMGLIPP